MINELTNGPMGTHNYSADINTNATLVFAGDGEMLLKKPGNNRNPYLKGKAVLFFDRLPDTSQPQPAEPIEKRIQAAMELGAAAVVVVAGDDSFPLYAVSLEHEIPVISIDRQNARAVFAKAGMEIQTLTQQLQAPSELPVVISLHVEGISTTLGTKNIGFHFQPAFFSPKEINRIKSDNERAVEFLTGLFQESGLTWSREQITYFGDFESKIFYTGYWGRGFSCDEGVYNVYIPEANTYGLAVHENTHSLLRMNGLSFCSFFDEGIARYAEAAATGEDLNNGPAAGFLRSDSLLRLEELIDINIGTHPLETKIGYPASGSFVQFLVERYGTRIILKLNKSSFDESARRQILSLEKDWLLWLSEKYNLNPACIDKHLKRPE